jgi:hypothetical protein
MFCAYSSWDLEMNRFKQLVSEKQQTADYLDSQPAPPPMGWLALADTLARAQEEGRSIDYYNANGKFKLKIGKQPKHRQWRCGAKTRTGMSCQMRVVPEKRRCRLHGGLSTGPRTPEGRAKIAESNRRRARSSSDAIN